MAIFRLNKLVRDNIPETQIAQGQQPVYRMLPRKEHRAELIKKVAEEASELAKAGAENLAKEVADLEQVLDDLKTVAGIVADVQAAKAARLRKMGGFTKGLFVETIEMPEDNPWTSYYRAESKRFEELEQKLGHRKH